MLVHVRKIKVQLLNYCIIQYTLQVVCIGGMQSYKIKQVAGSVSCCTLLELSHAGKACFYGCVIISALHRQSHCMVDPQMWHCMVSSVSALHRQSYWTFISALHRQSYWTCISALHRQSYQLWYCWYMYISISALYWYSHSLIEPGTWCHKRLSTLY